MTRKVRAHVVLHLTIPPIRLAHLDLTPKDEEDDAPYLVVADYIAENLSNLMDYAAPVESVDVDVDLF